MIFKGYTQSLNSLKGIVLDSETQNPLVNVTVTLVNTSLTQLTNINGSFTFKNIPKGNQLLKISLQGYESQNFPIRIDIENKETDLGTLLLYLDLTQIDNGGLISLTEDELNDDTTGADNISGLLHYSKDIFLNTAAFEFSSTFFKVRGLGSENSTVLLNGIEMNKTYNGRPQWSNWGGLNDVFRNQEFTTGLSASETTFGGVLGTTSINLRASAYRTGGRVTYSSTNKSYIHRVIASYASGLTKSGWAYTVAAGRRWGNEGFVDGTFYDANSFFTSIEKKLNDSHSLNLTAIYAPNRRGKSSPNTQEVFDLKGIKYNAYWGVQDGVKRNSRIKEVIEPLVMLNHYWNLNKKTNLNTNIGYQFGKQGNSRLDYGGTDKVLANEHVSYAGNGSNPSPEYYQKLPSFFLRYKPQHIEDAYWAQQEFKRDGQLNWQSLYKANMTNTANGGNAIYTLYEDRNDDTQLTFNSILTTEISEHISLSTSVNYRNLTSENFAEVLDLLGAEGYLDIDGFADDLSNNFEATQNDVNKPERIAKVGETFKYNYNLFATTLNGFAQAQFNYTKIDFYLSGSYTNTSYQREGLYKNGSFIDNSFGKGEKLSFAGLGAKGGFTYKITGRHLLSINAGYITKAPSLRNTYSNVRENHAIVRDITEEKIMTADANYILRSPKIKARLTGYYTTIKDANEISFFYADGIGGDNSAFVQETLQGISKNYMGGEFGIEVQLIPSFKIKGVAAVGEYMYTNNPNLYLTTEPSKTATAAGFVNGFKDFGKSNLKNYKLAGGPQRAYSLGFEYRDPNYWWLGATTNYFSNAYADISPLTRTKNFYTDFDGLAFNDYDEELAQTLLLQEQFNDYFLVNVVGGKSWKIKDYYIGFFASINNVLNQQYKTGGFEQGRNANYRQLRDDKSLDSPIFGSKYWYGRGTTYFLNLSIRF